MLIKYRRKIIIILSWGVTILWMSFIFVMSSQTADSSNDLSKGITYKIINFIVSLFSVEVEKDTINEWTLQLNHLVRKAGHVLEYFILGLLVINSFRRSGCRSLKCFLYAFVFCVLYSISDELHQIFIPGRAGMGMDILIDGFGSTMGIGLYWVVTYVNGVLSSSKIAKFRIGVM